MNGTQALLQGQLHRFLPALLPASSWGSARRSRPQLLECCRLIAEGDYVVGRWEGGGTHTGPAFSDFLAGSLPAASGRMMRFIGTTVLRVENGKIAEEIGLDDSVTALQQLGICQCSCATFIPRRRSKLM